MRCIRAVVAGW